MTNPAALAERFPADFIFGTATASYQIEGAIHEDGRKPSIWDTFSAEPGRVRNGDSGEVACDHYHRRDSDLDLLSHYAVQAYRFSIAWPRVIPDGRGPVNQKGLDWYDALIDGLLARDIKVFATLYHWDLPQALQDKGGWTNRDTAHAFADYTQTVVSRLGDRIDALATFNEPYCSCYLGHLKGIHAPGTRDLETAMRSVHVTNLAHGLSVQAARAARTEVPIGTVINAMAIAPETECDDDKAAAEREFQMYNGVFFTPLFDGRYDNLLLQELGALLDIRDGDLDHIQQPLDWWGLNYYSPACVADARSTNSVFPHTESRDATTSTARTDIGWEIDASAIERLLSQLYERYSLPPCYITENGACYNMGPDEGGLIDDQPRLNYLHDHISAIANARGDGIDIRGYFAWSLMDNFEWTEGYTMRFGLTYVDYNTQERTVKKSGNWYRELLASPRG